MKPNPRFDSNKFHSPSTIEDLKAKAKNGDPDAQFHLGFSYLEGRKGLEKNSEEAIGWFQKSADQGNDSAQCMMGYFYYDGIILDQSFLLAGRWFLKAAEQGNDQAQFMMGELHLLGKGVIEDYVEAYKYFNLAAAFGFGFESKEAVKKRTQLRKLMTREQIAEGQRRAALAADRQTR